MKPERFNRASWCRRFLRSRLMISINLLAVGFVGASLARTVSGGNEVDAQYAELQKKITLLASQNSDYSEVISRLGTSGFVEREARLKLGYQKPGEQVLVLKDQPTALGVAAVSGDDPSLTNPQKWWCYFFSR
jgi:hypothetical protein